MFFLDTKYSQLLTPLLHKYVAKLEFPVGWDIFWNNFYCILQLALPLTKGNTRQTWKENTALILCWVSCIKQHGLNQAFLCVSSMDTIIIITSSNQRLVKCIRSFHLERKFHCTCKFQLTTAKKTLAHEIEGICATCQSKMAPKHWNRMTSWSIPAALVHKTHKSDFGKNDTISMHSSSSNAIIHCSHHLSSHWLKAYS